MNDNMILLSCKDYECIFENGKGRPGGNFANHKRHGDSTRQPAPRTCGAGCLVLWTFGRAKRGGAFYGVVASLHNDRYVKPTPAGSRRVEAEDGR